MNMTQQEIIENFYKKQRIWFQDNWGNKAVAILMIGISYMLFLFPYNSWDGEYSTIIIMGAMQLMGYIFYIRKFTTYKEDGKVKSLYKVISILPIDKFQLELYIAQKVAKPSAILAIFAMFVQTMIYVSTNHAFSVGTLLVPFGSLFVLPELLVFFDSAFDKWNYK